MKKIFLLLLIPFSLSGQPCPPNDPDHFCVQKEKYWIYRERLKDYMISGTAEGNDIPAVSREAPTSAIRDRMNWNDSPWFISYWMGTLAMEYDLLVKSNAPASQISQTQQDLFNAIEAVNRLDFEAESPNPLGWNCGSSLNGFSIDDDVPNDFHQRLYNGETGADLLNVQGGFQIGFPLIRKKHSDTSIKIK